MSGHHVEPTAQHPSLIEPDADHFRFLIESVQDYAIFSLDTAGYVTSWNLGAEKITQYTAREIISQPFSCFYTKDDRGRGIPQQELHAAFIEERYENEARRVRKDGTEFWATVTITALWDRFGHHVGFSVIARDIDRRKREEIALRERLHYHEQLARMAAIAPGVLCSFRFRPDGTGCCPYTLDTIEEIYGLQPADIAEDASPILDRIHPDDRGYVQGTIDESARTMSMWTAEYRVCHPRKGEIWVEGRSIPVREPDGGIHWFGFLTDVTERKQVEMNLKERNQFISSIANTTPNWIYVYNRINHSNLYTNNQVTHLLGYTPEELQERGEGYIFPFMHPDDLESVFRYDGQIREIRDGEVKEIEYRIRHKNGEWRWFRGRDTVFKRDADGTVVEVLGTATDVTGHKKAEKSLYESQRYFRELVEGLPHLVWTCGNNGKCTYLSPQWVEYTGIAEADHIGFGWMELLHPEDHAFVVRAWERAVETQAGFEVEFRLRRADGVYRWFKTRAVPVGDSGGETVKWFGTSTDIDEQKRAEKELRDSETRYRSLVQATSHIIWRSDARGRLTEVTNDENFYQGGQGPTGWEWINLIHPDECIRVLQGWADATRHRTVHETEYRLRHLDGSYHHYLARAVPILDEAGRLTEWIGTASDITERKQAEEALVQNEANLKALIENTGGVIWAIDTQYRLIVSNLAFRSLLQQYWNWDLQPRESLLSEYFEQEWKSLVDRALGGERFRFEKTSRVIPGERNLEFFFHPIYNGNEIVGVTVFGHDITERKTAEEALRRSELLNRRLVEHLPQRIFIKDRNSVYISCNSNLARDFGIEPTDIAGKDDFAFFPKEVAERYQAIDRLVLDSGELHEREEVYVIGGKKLWARITKIPFHDEQGRIIGVLGYFEDITERKRVMELQAARLRLLQYAVDHSSSELLQKTLDEVGLLTESPIGFYHYLEPDQRTIHFQMWSTRTVEEFCQVEGEKHRYDLAEAGIWADCVRERRPIIHNSFPAVEDRHHFPQGHPGISRQLVVPIFREGLIVAILGIGNKPDMYTEQDITVVSQFADLAWDITERKRVEEQNREHRLFLETLFDTIPSPVYHKNVQGVYTGCNRAFLEFFGRKKEEIVGKTVFEVGHGEFAAVFHQKDQEMFQKTGKQCYELKMRNAQGEIRDTVFDRAPLYDSGTALTGLIGVFSDITEHKRAAEELEASRRLLLSLLEAIPDLLVVIDRNHQIRYSNFKGLGLNRRSDSKAHPCFGALQFLEKPCNGCCARKVFETGRMVEKEAISPVDGHTWEVRAFPIRNEAGEVELVVQYIRDITIRKREEEERKNLEAQLLQSQKMEAIGRLAGGVAHDYNNMMGVIIGFADLALKKLTPQDSLHQNLTQIRIAGHRSANLTRQLLAFARQEAISPKILDLNDVIDQSKKMLIRLLGEDIVLDFHPDPTLPAVEMDPTQVNQILVNLAVNARDAIAGVGTMTIKTATVFLDETDGRRLDGCAPGKYVELTFSDTGCGMDKPTMDRIFDPFFTTKPEGKGTGLGLSTVYGIVKQNRGRIAVQSSVGHGTAFRIYLPPAKEVNEPEEDTIQHETSKGTETILVVEDEEQILEVTCLSLEAEGYNVLSAHSPGDALVVCKEYRKEIHLLITDVVMPTMDGKELKSSIEPMKPGIRTLYMSGYTAEIIASRGVVPDGIGFIQKPFSPGDLAKRVRDILDLENNPGL